MVGILSFSRIIEYLLIHHKSVTMAFLVGLMIGTLRLPYEKIVVSMESPIPIVVAAVIKFAIVFILEKRFESHPLSSNINKK